MFSFEPLQNKHAELTLKWRTSALVQNVSTTEISHDIHHQLQWIEAVRNSSTEQNWLICYRSKLIGLVGYQKFDPVHRTAYGNFYIGEEALATLGLLALPYFYNHIFKILSLKVLYGEVLSSNDQIEKINLLHGYEIVNKKLRTIEKGENLIEVKLMSLRAEKWATFSQHNRKIATFSHNK